MTSLHGHALHRASHVPTSGLDRATALREWHFFGHLEGKCLSKIRVLGGEGASLVINRHLGPVGVYVRTIPETPAKEVTSRL